MSAVTIDVTVVVTKINLAICWKLREDLLVLERSSDNPKVMRTISRKGFVRNNKESSETIRKTVSNQLGVDDLKTMI